MESTPFVERNDMRPSVRVYPDILAILCDSALKYPLNVKSIRIVGMVTSVPTRSAKILTNVSKKEFPVDPVLAVLIYQAGLSVLVQCLSLVTLMAQPVADLLIPSVIKTLTVRTTRSVIPSLRNAMVCHF